MNNFFVEPDGWQIGKSVFAKSLTEMAIDGANGNEGVAMWLGRHNGPITTITHLGKLRGPHVRKAPDLLMIDSELINDLTDLAIDAGVRLVGQIHSHGPRFGTNLSETDRRYAIAVPGMLSLVAPDYGLRPHTTLYECGVHLFQLGHGWRRLPTTEVERRVAMFDDGDATVLTAGT